ncbi:CRISPR-associated helicase Cas3' [Picosynechococcus sp. PCC 73109]|uniref:CRISPR-associated helicase Cas3' n=1 Tax=Picosynechococcus sp. PCC 73109 TaxID=374982 RepID=UPI0007459522|nr:CRISPR-associated helicase Cas3' [Picosynechococcus sp. PCC 73109]AMA10854.1 CRISPR-associated helicase Cas3 [Picosynechococcus sp. PCC 73109]
MIQAKKRQFIFGRVFFPDGKNKIPKNLLFQPLGNHVANVTKLVSLWNWQSPEFVNIADLDAAKKRTLRAAKIHDMGKPQKFKFKVEVKNNKPKLIYSFSGHRFLAEDKHEPWAEYLAKGHHDFSIHDIARDSYKLKTLAQSNNLLGKASQYREILEADPLAYARELYILEMCDQIEAEIACRFYDDDEQAESRAFMDFNIVQDPQNNYKFSLEPWVFGDDVSEISLPLTTWSMPFPKDLKQEMESYQGDRLKDKETDWAKRLNKAVKDWWNNNCDINSTRNNKHIIILKRLVNEKLGAIDCNTLYLKIPEDKSFTPNEMQQAVMDNIIGEDKYPALLLKAPTGSGKTEAILFPALANRNRLFLVLPTRSLIEDQSERIDKYLTRFSALEENQDRQFSLVIDTGSVMTRKLYGNGENFKPKNNPRRHLYKGDVILTTLDKFIYRYFAFGDKQKSFIFPHRIQQQKTLICFDEAHSYENIAFTNFQSLVKSLYEQGRSLVLMTATMPEKLIKTFDYLEPLDFSDFVEPKLRSFDYLDKISIGEEQEDGSFDSSNFQEQVTAIALEEIKAKPQRRILLIVETVKDAVGVYLKLKEKLNPDNLFLYHGRIADQLRPDIYQQIKQRDDNGQPYILVTTRAIEVGCDLNAETLITQICPPENLIQRVGRCNRRGNVQDAKVIVVGDRIPDFLNTLDTEAWNNYRSVLSQLNEFDAEAVGDCIFSQQQVDDYRVLETFSMLHDYVYGSDLTCQGTHEKGVIPTRSWQPSVTLQFIGKDHSSEVDITDEKPHSITVPIERLCGGSEYAHVNVQEQFYDKDQTKWSKRSLRWGSAYNKNILVTIRNEDQIGLCFAHALENYQYDSELGFVDLPKVFIKIASKGTEEKLLHICEKNGEKHKSIISYIKENIN